MKILQNCLLLIPLFFSMIDGFPCPMECICKPRDSNDFELTPMSFIIDCSGVPLINNRLSMEAGSWAIQEEKILGITDDDDESIDSYTISLDLTNSLTLKSFNRQTIQFKGFSFVIESLSLTNQSNKFILESNAFNDSQFKNLRTLNLSNCCQQIPIECPQLFSPLEKLEILDLSGSDMYKHCLDRPDTISSNLRDLILRNNDYDGTTFSHTSRLFDGVVHVTGRLDFKYSRFQLGNQLEGNCLFDLFKSISSLDLSYVEFQSISNENEIHLKHFLQCKSKDDETRNGEDLLDLYLSGLNLKHLPIWLNATIFPRLKLLDLSKNQLKSIDLRDWNSLKHISLAFNPIDFNEIQWRSTIVYHSINLRSTNRNRDLNLTETLKKLFQLSGNVDFADNVVDVQRSFQLKQFSIELDFYPNNEISLNLSRTNLKTIQFDDSGQLENLRRLDLSENFLTELDLSQQKYLSHLQCSNQNLTQLTLSKNNFQLIELNCSRNSLKTIESFSSHQYQRLKIIDLSFNFIENLENLFANLTSRYLRLIDLKSNRIDKIRSKTFHRKLINLYSIDLSNNRINSIEKNAFQLVNLQMLDLTGNPLKMVEANFILTSSLRFFFLINHTDEWIDRCAKSTSDNSLLTNYIEWFEKNGTFMKTMAKQRSEQIQSNQCFRRYISRSKVKWTKINGKTMNKHLSLYITMFIVSIGLIFALIFLYQKHKQTIRSSCQRYRPLDRNCLMESVDELARQRPEDDEIAMNLEEPPFNRNERS